MIVVVEKPGQLGNRLLRFAQFIAYALDHDVRVADLSFGDYAAHFPALTANPFCEFPAPRRSLIPPTTLRKALFHAGYYSAGAIAKTSFSPPRTRLVRLDWHEYYDLDADPLELHRPGLVLAQGWSFRAEKGVVAHADEVRRFLTPHPHTIRAARDAADRMRSECDVVVGLHVRHGDYRHWQGGRYYLSLEQYAAVGRVVEASFGPAKVGFLICSDETYTPNDFPGLKACMGPGDAVGDLYSLAACDYLVGPVSTFTMWASFYGRVPLCTIINPAHQIRLEDFQVSRLLPPGASVDYGLAELRRRPLRPRRRT